MTSPICTTCGQPVMTAERRLRDEIRDLLFASDITQKDLAEQLGITQKHMSQMITGRAHLNLEMAEKILAILGHVVSIQIEPIGRGAE